MLWSAWIIVFISVKKSFPCSSVTLIGNTYQVSHASSAQLDTNNARTRSTYEFFQPVSGSTIVTTIK